MASALNCCSSTTSVSPSPRATLQLARPPELELIGHVADALDQRQPPRVPVRELHPVPEGLVLPVDGAQVRGAALLGGAARPAGPQVSSMLLSIQRCPGRHSNELADNTILLSIK